MKKTVKNTVSMLAAVCMAMCLTACMGDEVFEEKPKKPSPISEVQDKLSDLPKNTEEPETEEPEPVLDEVLGNDTDFVKVGERVYFREYDSEAMDCSIIWGDIHGYVPEKGKRYIKYFNVNTGDVQKAFEDEGYGTISYYNGLFYLKDVNGVYTVSEDGSGKTYLEIEGTTVLPQRIIGNYLFYTYGDDSSNELRCLNLDNNEITSVCPIPEDEERGWPTICQIEVVDEDVYVGISYIAGTGHFHQGGDIYKASVLGDKEPELVREMQGFEEGEEYIYIKEDGSYDFGNHAPGSAYMDGSDIWVCEKDGSTRCFLSNFLNDRRGMISDYAESLSYLDGSVYLIRNAMRYTKEDDVGWREAYRVFRSSNIKISGDSTINEFNIVKGNPETIPANVYYIHETGKNGETQVLYQPYVIVHPQERELCEKLGVDPDDPEMFLENMHVADPYYSEGFVASLSDNLTAETINYESPDLFESGGKDELVAHLLSDPYDMYTMLSLTDLQHDEWMDYYVFPEYDYSNPDAPYYNSIFAYITFNEDGSAISSVEEIYIP